MDVAKIVAKVRASYHMNMTSIVNAANQLNLISDEKAEKLNSRHVMILIEDVWPRIYGADTIAKLMAE